MEQQATLVFFVKRDENRNILEVCLGMKKRGFGMGKWNGFGGKVGDKKKETIKEAACREVLEEAKIQILPDQLSKVAELDFKFEENSEWDQVVSVFLIEEWVEEPTESEEMKPEWFSVDNLPYAEMWVDDGYWVPFVLKNSLVEGEFVFTKEGKSMKNMTLNVVDKIEENNELIERKLS